MTNKLGIGQEMQDQTYQCFLAGLAHLIKTTRGVTQKSLAAKIKYSEQHLSNVMTGSRIASDDLLGLLANEFQCDVSDVVIVGRSVTNGKYPLVAPLETSDKEDVSDSLPEMWEPSALKGMSVAELTRESSQYTETMTEGLVQHGQMVASRMRAVVDERNRLYNELQQMQAICESMGDAVKVDDKSRAITYSNRAYKKLSSGIDREECCPGFCGEHDNCYIEEVFETGEEIHKIRSLQGKRYGVKSSPILDNSGVVVKVVTVIREIKNNTK